MTTVTSCGLLLWRDAGDGVVEVLVGHMGGPFWARRDDGAWTIPKGLAEPGDVSPLATAQREFTEELGQTPPPPAPTHPDLDLGTATTRGKAVTIVARHAADWEPDPDAQPGTFTMQWPPKSGREATFPEVDRIAWLPIDRARDALAGNQQVFLDRLVAALDGGHPTG